MAETGCGHPGTDPLGRLHGPLLGTSGSMQYVRDAVGGSPQQLRAERTTTLDLVDIHPGGIGFGVHSQKKTQVGLGTLREALRCSGSA